VTARARTRSCEGGVLAVFLVILTAGARAHRLDEYLQAARLSLAHERIAVELDLTPGVSIAPAILSTIDRDTDRIISPQEARAYAQTVLSEVALSLDGRAVVVTLDRVEVPPAGDLRAGLGTIELRASGTIERLAAGRHELQFRNDHHPESAAYLINALAPGNAAVRVASQHRDPMQREGRIEYEIAPASSLQWLWLVPAVACFHRYIRAGSRRLMNLRHRTTETFP
jgi:nickel/cobalt transporter (NicO) family protein